MKKIACITLIIVSTTFPGNMGDNIWMVLTDAYTLWDTYRICEYKSFDLRRKFSVPGDCPEFIIYHKPTGAWTH